MTTQLFRRAIAKPLASLSNQTEQKVLGILNTPKIALNHQFGVPIPKLASTTNPVTYCKELASKVYTRHVAKKPQKVVINCFEIV